MLEWINQVLKSLTEIMSTQNHNTLFLFLFVCIKNTQHEKLKQGEGYCTHRIERRSLAGAPLLFSQDNLSALRLRI